MSSQATDRIIAKLKKVLAMANSQQNENEAQVAMSQLHKMLAKHNMSMADVENADDGTEEKVDQDGKTLHHRPWKSILANGIGRLYFCKTYMNRSYGHNSKQARYFFIGTEANRAYAMAIFEMAVKMVESEARKACYAEYGTLTRQRPFLTSFWNGAADRVHQRCMELIRDAEEGNLQDEDGTLLPVMRSTYELHRASIQDYINSADLGLRQKNDNRQTRNSAGRAAGTAAGNKVRLSRALQGRNSQKLIG